MGITKALVSGGGVGGLAAATALSARGVEVDLIEIKDNFDVYGVGLGQPVNALRALRDIGVVDQVLEAGFAFDRLRICDRDGSVMLDYGYRLDDPVLPAVSALPRKALHEILVRSARESGSQLRLGTTIASLTQTPDAAEVVLSDGSERSYDLVVGFDGINSSTREFVLGHEYAIRNSGYSAWRVTVPRHERIQQMDFYQGFGSKTGFMPLTEDSMYMFHICPEPVDVWYEQSQFLELFETRLEQYGGVVAEVRNLLTADDEIIYSPLQPHLVSAPWHNGRVVIAGDAAHAFPPHMTQGAGMALEDAVVLAEEVTSAAPLAESLARFHARRFERCAFVADFAGRMLEYEQRIKNSEDLATAEQFIRNGQEARLAGGDFVMNQPVLQSDHRVVQEAGSHDAR